MKMFYWKPHGWHGTPSVFVMAEDASSAFLAIQRELATWNPTDRKLTGIDESLTGPKALSVAEVGEVIANNND